MQYAVEELCKNLKEVMVWNNTNDEFMDKLYNIGIVVSNSWILEKQTRAENMVFKYLSQSIASSQEDVDKIRETLNWFFYEYLFELKLSKKKPCKETAAMWDEQNNPICYDFESLSDYLIKTYSDKNQN